MVDGLNDLVGLNVLRLGAYLRCALCGIETWFHVDDLKQEVNCPGCGRRQAIGAQQDWHYALNSLVEMGVKQGQLPVIQALAALAAHSFQSFFYSPSLHLFKAGTEGIWHEVDILAVVNGEFVIGEVKGGNVTRDDFFELAEIAEVLRPQRAIMFLPKENVTQEVVGWGEEAKRHLAPRGIKAEISALPVF